MEDVITEPPEEDPLKVFSASTLPSLFRYRTMTYGFATVVLFFSSVTTLLKTLVIFWLANWDLSESATEEPICDVY